MRIKFYFIFLALFLLVLTGVLGWMMKEHFLHYIYWIGGLVFSLLVYLFLFYRKIVKPLRTIGNGMELLREQDFSSRLSPVGQYDADRLVNLFNRMMEQLKNERLRLREQNHFLDLLIQASPMGVVILTFDREISQLNPMAEKLLGIRQKEVQGMKLSETGSLLAAELVRIPVDKTEIVRLTDANIYKCMHTTFIDHGFKHPFYLIECMTEEVMRAEKRAYEKVIRMIAHEVNNTTAGITSTLDTVEQALGEERGMEDICEVMRVCVERCYSMSRFITRFADVVKIPEPVMTAVSLNEMAATCKRFMEGICNEHDIVLQLECDETVGQVSADASLLEQVLVNIIKNAVESIQSARLTDPDRVGQVVIKTVAPATIVVVDNGAGILPEAETKLFTPFFSTKPNGQGIGLIFIREVLTRHGCTFSLRTYVDGMTRFGITFPLL